MTAQYVFFGISVVLFIASMIYFIKTMRQVWRFIFDKDMSWVKKANYKAVKKHGMWHG